jgi:hypothetical protein
VGAGVHHGRVLNTPRPTLRCLREDLRDDWNDVRQQRGLTQLDSCPPLHALDHPLIRHAVAMFEDGDAQANRESISGLYDPMWYKLKSGRWRGAVFVDDTGQAWLCAAGRRYEGESKDFYKSFSGDIGAGGTQHYLPTAEDRKRLRREDAEMRLSVWERALHEQTVGSLQQASVEASTSFDLHGLMDQSFILAEVTLEVVRLEDGSDSIADIVVTVATRDWGSTAVVARAELVIMAAICPDEESWVAGHTGAEHIYSVTGSTQTIDALIEAAPAADLVPGRTLPGTRSHYTHKVRLTEKYVEGTATRALCGVAFVPRRAPDGLPVCAQCEGIMKLLQPSG